MIFLIMQKPAFERRRGQFGIEGSALKLPLKGLCPFGGFGRSPLSIIAPAIPCSCGSFCLTAIMCLFVTDTLTGLKAEQSGIAVSVSSDKEDYAAADEGMTEKRCPCLRP